MEHESITKLREIANTPHNPRNTHEWPQPVLPSDLLVLFSHYDALLANNNKTQHTQLTSYYDRFHNNDVRGGFFTD
jgi:hypothetical protein